MQFNSSLSNSARVGGVQALSSPAPVQSAPGAAPRDSLRSVHDFSTLTAENRKANLLLNDTDNERPIAEKNPYQALAQARLNIKHTAEEWKMSETEVKGLLGDPDQIMNPSCGTVANNLMKLFLDAPGRNYHPVQAQKTDLAGLKRQLDALAPDKSYLLHVMDGPLSHAYVLDLPAGGGQGGERQGWLYQSDMGEGATRQLSLTQWMDRADPQPLALGKMLEHFDNMQTGRADAASLGEIFDVARDMDAIRPEKLKFGAASQYSLQEYRPENLRRNLDAIKELSLRGASSHGHGLLAA